MKDKIFVPIHPETLKWIRIELGLSSKQVADKINVSIKQLNNWENGNDGITLSQAKKLAEKYKVSLPFLYLKEISKKHRFKNVIDFRNQSHKKKFSDKLCLAIKITNERQTWLREFLQAEEEKPLEWLGKFSRTRNIINIAKRCRQWLGIEQGEINDLKDNKEALDYWKTKIESKGVVVASNHTHAAYKIDRKEFSGLVLYDEYAPFILLNPKDSPARQIFTLLHELAHLLVKPENSLSMINFRADESEYDEIEVICNNIASNILINRETIKSFWNEKSSKKSSIKDNISSLSKIFKASQSAIALVVKGNGIINQTELTKLLDFYKKEYEKNLRKSKEKSGGRIIPDKQVLDRCGKLLTTQVLTAYEQGSINASEIHDVLGLKLKYLGDLSKRLDFPLHRWIS